MSDETVDSSERETLPVGHRSAPTHVLTTIADVPWKRMQVVERDDDAPVECYFAEVDDLRVRFERTGREWQGYVSVGDGEARESETLEDMGKAARQLRSLIEEMGGDI